VDGASLTRKLGVRKSRFAISDINVVQKLLIGHSVMLETHTHTHTDGLRSHVQFNIGQTPKSDIPPNIAPNVVTPENYLQI